MLTGRIGETALSRLVEFRIKCDYSRGGRLRKQIRCLYNKPVAGMISIYILHHLLREINGEGWSIFGFALNAKMLVLNNSVYTVATIVYSSL